MLVRIIVYNRQWHFALALAKNAPKFPVTTSLKRFP